MYVSISRAGDWTVQGPATRWQKLAGVMRSPAGGLLSKILRTSNPVLHSPAVLPSRWPRLMHDATPDVIHLHWVNGEMMSIADIGCLNEPVVWTLHDMWAFCGAEHYTDDARWKEGYTPGNRPPYEGGFDLNRWTWMRKCKHWKRPRHIVAPSRWLANAVSASALMRNWPVMVIPNPIDTNLWRPVDKLTARELLGLPAAVPLLLFGAIGGAQDSRKGFDLLRSTLEVLKGELYGMELVVFGQLSPKDKPDLCFPVHYVGHLHDDISLRLLYSAADAIVVPSRQEAFGQTASEAHACGTPAVAFDNSGLADVVEHGKTGYLARAFDIEDLAAGLRWTIEDKERNATLGVAARDRAERLWSYEVVAPQYLEVYRQAINAHQ